MTTVAIRNGVEYIEEPSTAEWTRGEVALGEWDGSEVSRVTRRGYVLGALPFGAYRDDDTVDPVRANRLGLVDLRSGFSIGYAPNHEMARAFLLHVVDLGIIQTGGWMESVLDEDKLALFRGLAREFNIAERPEDVGIDDARRRGIVR